MFLITKTHLAIETFNTITFSLEVKTFNRKDTSFLIRIGREKVSGFNVFHFDFYCPKKQQNPNCSSKNRFPHSQKAMISKSVDFLRLSQQFFMLILSELETKKIIACPTVHPVGSKPIRPLCLLLFRLDHLTSMFIRGNFVANS